MNVRGGSRMRAIWHGSPWGASNAEQTAFPSGFAKVRPRGLRGQGRSW
jgi:hypothetical protein